MAELSGEFGDVELLVRQGFASLGTYLARAGRW